MNFLSNAAGQVRCSRGIPRMDRPFPLGVLMVMEPSQIQSWQLLIRGFCFQAIASSSMRPSLRKVRKSRLKACRARFLKHRLLTQKKDAFFVVKKGDVVRFCRNSRDFQAQVGSLAMLSFSWFFGIWNYAAHFNCILLSVYTCIPRSILLWSLYDVCITYNCVAYQ